MGRTETTEERLARLSTYGILKEAQVRSALPVDLQEQLEALEGRRGSLSRHRATEKNSGPQALQLHAERQAVAPTAASDLFVYADEVGRRMGDRHR
jgi:hypothetical protein